MKNEYYDENIGLPLPKDAVEAAMGEELAEFEKHEVGEEVGLEECHRVAGAPVASCRWRIHNKGGSDHINVRARLVAREMKSRKPGWETVCAGTPRLWKCPHSAPLQFYLTL